MDPLVGLFDPGPEEPVELPESLPPEIEEGNVEYKLKLVAPTKSRFEHLVTQMKWRLQEGQGEAIYEIGVEDNGLLAGLTNDELQASLDTLDRMARKLGAATSVLRERDVEPEAKYGKRVAEVLVRKVPDNQQFIDLRLAVLGNVDTGKSTLLGVLTQGELDNGRGRARLNLFRHLHEIQSGRTSSISHEILGFNSDGQVINYSDSRTAEEICDNSTKLITLIDLCGHHKYLKTTIFGLTGYSPDFAMLVVSANTGIVGTTKEHLGFALALGVPIFVVVSKIDMCRSSQVEKMVRQLEKLLKTPGCKKVPFRVENEDDAVTAASAFHYDRGKRLRLAMSQESLLKSLGLKRSSTHNVVASCSYVDPEDEQPEFLLEGCSVCPIFSISSVTGKNLNFLTKFLNVLPPLHSTKEREQFMQQHAEYQVDEVYTVQGAGIVTGGTILRGSIKEGEKLMLGPTEQGEFLQVPVHSIQRNRLPCRLATAGQTASLAIGHFSKCPVRKGTVLVSPELNPCSCLEFEADIYLLFHNGHICKGFQTVMHIGNVMQTAIVVKMNKKCIQTNEKAVVTFRFINRPEYIRVGTRLLFREGRTKGMGEVTKIFPIEDVHR